MRSVSGVRRLVLEATGVRHEAGIQAERRSRRASSPPITAISRNTISHVEEAPGSISGIVPSPSFERWWSIQISSLRSRRPRPERAEPVERCAVARDHHGGRLGEVGDLDEVVGARAGARPNGAAPAARSGTSRPSRCRGPAGTPTARASSRARRRRGSRGRRARPSGAEPSTSAARVELTHRLGPSFPSTHRLRGARGSAGRSAAACSTVASSSNSSSGQELQTDLLADHAAEARDRRAQAGARATRAPCRRRTPCSRPTRGGGRAVTFTPVTVTNPTRGSFSLGISSAKISRNSSPTRSILGPWACPQRTGAGAQSRHASG